jgi:hypothetical protein
MLGFYFCFCQAKQKQALLESNLPGIHLMTDEKVKRKEFALGLLFTFSDGIHSTKPVLPKEFLRQYFWHMKKLHCSFLCLPKETACPE